MSYRTFAAFLCVALYYSCTAMAMPVPVYYEYGSGSAGDARQMFDEQLLRLAEDKFIEMLNAYPDNPAADRAEILRANLDFKAGNYKNADGRLSSFILERPNSPFVPHAELLRGYIAYDLENYADAVKYLSEATGSGRVNFGLRQDSTYREIAHNSLFWHGAALIQQGRYEDAEPVLNDCHRLYPDLQYADDALFALGLAAETNRNYDMSINYYNTVASKYPRANTYLASRIREVNNRLILRDAKSAMAALEGAEITARYIDAGDEIGMTYERQDYISQGTENLMYLKGEAANMAGNNEKAIEVFEKFLVDYPASTLAHYVRLGIGWALLNKGEYKYALKYYNEIIKSDAPDGSHVKSIAKLYRTVALKQSGDKAQAEKELSALSLEPGYMFLGQALLELGQIYYEDAKYSDARRALERADREANEAIVAVRIHLMLGATYLELRSWSKAVNQYQAAENLALKGDIIFMPQKNWYIGESRYKRGIALVQSHRNGEAIPAFLAFLSENKGDPRADEAMFWLAEAYYRSDLLNNAADTYKSLLDLFPDSERREEALYGQGWAHFRLKRFKKSSQIFDQMISEFPESKYGLEVLARQGDAYYVTKSYSQAAASYKRAANMSPRTDEGQYAAYQLCHALYRMGSYEKAISSLLHFVRTYPNSPYAPFALYLNAWIRFQQKSFEESVDNFKYLILTYPQSDLVVRAHYAIGDAYYNLGNFEMAIGAYQQVVEQYPSHALAPEAINSIQYCYRALGQDEEAIKIADRFVETNPESPFAPEFKFKKAEMFYQGRDYGNAITEYQKFVEKYPDSKRAAEALYWTARSYSSMGEPDKAIKAFNDLRHKYPDNDLAPVCLLETGLVYKKISDIEKADSIFVLVSQQYPEHQIAAQAGFERAVIKQEMGDTLTALDMYRDVATSYPDMEYANQSLFRIAMYFRSRSMQDSARTIFTKLAQVYTHPELAAESQFHLGESWMIEEDYDKAADAFLIVKEKFGGYEDWFSLSILNLGECFEHLEEFDLAEEAYSLLVALRPDDEFGKSAQHRLKTLKKKNR